MKICPYLAGCVNALHTKDKCGFNLVLERAKEAVLKSSQIVCTETQEVYRAISCKLMMLSVAESCGKMMLSASAESQTLLDEFESSTRERFQGCIKTLENDYNRLQPILACYGRLLPLIFNENAFLGLVHELHVSTVRIARDCKDFVGARKV